MKPRIVELPQFNAFCFEGYGPGCEMKAFGRMTDWLEKQKMGNKSYRIYGHNIDSQGNLTYDPHHAGYKILLVIDDLNEETVGPEKVIITPGKFLVIRTEGTIADVGHWLMEGWSRVNKTIRDEKLKVRNPARWFEEHIKTPDSDYVIVDLYMEIE